MTPTNVPKSFASFQVGMVSYKKHQDQIVAAFSQFLVENTGLMLNVGSNITLGYPDPGILPQTPVNVITAYAINPTNISDLEKKVTESVIVKKILEPFKKKLLLEGPFKDRNDIMDAIVLFTI